MRDEFLTEAMGECWHEWDETDFIIEVEHECKKCGLDRYVNQDFSLWMNFGKLWEWAQEQEWWFNFLGRDTPFVTSSVFIHNTRINPDKFADDVYEFLKERNNES